MFRKVKVFPVFKLNKKQSNYITRVFGVALTVLLIVTSTVSAEELVDVTVRGADIRDVLLMLTEQSGINLVPDETVQGEVTINLRDVDLQEALKTLTMAYGYHFEKVSENVYLVSRDKLEAPVDVRVKDGFLTVHATNANLRTLLREIADKASINIVMDDSVSGKISIDLENIPLEVGLINLLHVNGFSLSKSNSVYRIFKADNNTGNNLAISVVDNRVSMDVSQANLGDVLRTLARLGDLDMVLFGGVRDIVDLKLEDISLDEAIEIILAGTRYTYRKVDGVYLIGDKNINSPASDLLTTSELIPMEYIEVEKVPQLLPNNFPAANVKVLKEKNALLVTGTQSDINKLKEYIKQIDTRIPLIVVEAVVVELTRNRQENPVIKLGMEYDGEEELLFDTSMGKLTYKSVLDLPDDFYLKIEALVTEGLLTVKARPNITTLNGQQAMIDVGTVQYYKVKQTDGEGNEETQYQSINAGVSLTVTPWVSSSGEITLKLRPQVSNIGAAAAEGPPQVSRREVDTTVRVKDGQTVVIGGLIQDVGTNTTSKVPFLANIPLIGKLFKSRNNNVNQTELIIFITPRVLKVNEEEVKSKMKKMLEKSREQLQ
ncbi:secretin and TonB N-terminal domain-containing protein [Halothermothrix orenii]|uniref:Type II and III secretion system protein n=1 Tax=Halothermothrix orenii (strain H 168 / OCM 544 / DSM 9562) TaxID=373903 RepID=B8CZ92_HALOH|nr:secretin and TonB N-terminal domain-containing protein [Halothermothrix orenii]ACL70611.1 type II and III secretion system protein [Halothermothrix orenii H 168]